jgi:recombination protein RecR
MSLLAAPIERLLAELERLPGVGPKTAQRLAYHLLGMESDEAIGLAEAITEATETIHHCRTCFDFTDEDECGICSDPGRDQTIIAVVEEPRDVIAIERTHEFHGRYHVLHGAVSPIDDIGIEDLHAEELLDRVREAGAREVIMATNPTLEGETTATILSQMLRPLGVKVTRLASGLPMGGDLEFADELTLGRALSGRREM